MYTSIHAITIGLIGIAGINNSTTVNTTHGPVVGIESETNNIRVFKGIPYAAKPIGDLRPAPP